MNFKKIYKNYIKNVGGDNATLRDEWVASRLKKMNSGQRILDVGAGEGRYKKYMSHLEYIAQDFNGYDGVGDGTGLHTGKWDHDNINIVSDITDIPVDDSIFDIVLCTEVLEHVPDARLSIREMIRVLKPGGKIIITAPFCSLTHFSPYHFTTGFNKYFYIDVLKANGCVIEELEPSGDWFSYVAQELRRFPSVVKLYTKSPIGILDKLLIGILLLRLSRYKEKQIGPSSSEILTYGYHVLATKNI